MLDKTLPLFRHITAVFTSSRGKNRHTILAVIARHAPQHHATHLLATRDTQFRSDLRAELIAEDIDAAQTQAIQEITDSGRQIGNRELGRRCIRRAMAWEIDCVDAAIGAELTQHRRKESSRAAAVMQADQRGSLVETA